MVFNHWKEVTYCPFSRRLKSFLYFCLAGANYLFNLFTMHKFNLASIYICDLEKVGANGSLAPPTNKRTYALYKEDLFPDPMRKK